MIAMNVLRMLSDVSFYCAFAGLIAAAFGGSGAFAGALLQSLAFGLSRVGGEKRPMRLLLLLVPLAAGWVIHWGNWADCVLLLPTAVYLLRLTWKGDYALDLRRQQRLFGVFWKVLLFVVPMALLMGGGVLAAAVTAPYALMMLVSSVLLMRALRHDPGIFCRARYQAVNLSAVALLLAVAGLVSTQTFRKGCVAVLGAVHTHVFRPMLEVLLNLFLLVIWGLSRLFSLFSCTGARPQGENVELDLTGAKEIFGDSFQPQEPGTLLRALGWVLLAAAVAVLLVLFFRWLNRRESAPTTVHAGEPQRSQLRGDRPGTRERENSPVRRIRAQYRSLLKWCAGMGVRKQPDSTSLELHRQISLRSGRHELSAQIRQVYIRARYAHRADRADVRRMKQLCEQLMRSDKDMQNKE